MKFTEEVIARHRSLVEVAAKKHWYRVKNKTWLSLDDLLQAGYIGLMEGCERFDPSFGVKEATFLWPTVDWAIRKEITKNGHTLKVGQKFKQKAIKVRNADTQDVAVLAQRLEVTEAEIKTMQAYLSTEYSSLEYDYGDEGDNFTLHEIIGVEDRYYEESDAREKIEQYCVSELDRRIIRLREHGYSLQEIAQMVENVPNHKWNRPKNEKQISETLRRLRRRMQKGEEGYPKKKKRAKAD